MGHQAESNVKNCKTRNLFQICSANQSYFENKIYWSWKHHHPVSDPLQVVDLKKKYWKENFVGSNIDFLWDKKMA